MNKLQGEKIYLSTLEREHWKKIWEDTEYDFDRPTELFIVGRSSSNADKWFDETQKEQGEKFIRLGIFLSDGTLIGDIALQSIDWKNRSCTLGYGLTKPEYRGKGYTTDAAKTILKYGFGHLGLERISAATQEENIGSQRVLEKCGFKLEGRERKAEYLHGKRYDRLMYGLLADEFTKIV